METQEGFFGSGLAAWLLGGKNSLQPEMLHLENNTPGKCSETKCAKAPSQHFTVLHLLVWQTPLSKATFDEQHEQHKPQCVNR